MSSTTPPDHPKDRSGKHYGSPDEIVESTVQRMKRCLGVLERWSAVIEDEPDVYAMKALSEMAAVRDQLNTDLRLLAEHTANTSDHTRNAIAKAAGVANTTVNAWVARPQTNTPAERSPRV